MSTETTLKAISAGITIVNSLISISENSAKYRQMVTEAISEGRDLSEEDLAELREEAQSAINEARKD